MTEVRAVPLSQEQYLMLEDLGKSHMRAGNFDLATKIMAIALSWKVAPVVRFDESAGTNVVELHGHSRKVPCV